MQQTIVDRIEAEHENNVPTCVLSVASRSYAHASGENPEVRAGLRGMEDWLVELEACSTADAHYLEGKYGVKHIHYMVDDSSTDEVEFANALLTLMEPAPPTISLAEVVQMCITAQTEGKPLSINGATWCITR